MLLLLNALMTLSWMSAWGSFLVSSIAGVALPFPLLLGIFAAGAFTGMFFVNKNPLIFTVLLVHVAAICVCCMASVHYFQYNTYPLLDSLWLAKLLKETKRPLTLLTAMLICICVLIVYLMGLRLIKKRPEHTRICMSFDVGITAFFVLFLVVFLMEARLGMVVEDKTAGKMILPFFIFSLLTIGVSANRGEGVRRSFSRPLGAVMAYCATALGLGTGLMLFFMPYLTQAAGSIYAVIRIAGAPLGSLVTAFLAFLFRPRAIRSSGSRGPAGSDSAPHLPQVEQGGWMQEIGLVLAWALAVMLALAAAAALAAALWYLIRWLFSRAGGGTVHDMKNDFLLEFLKATWQAIRKAMAFVPGRRRVYESAKDFYLALQRWGKKRGFPRYPSETPNEYSARLRAFVPSLDCEFHSIASLFNEESYSGRKLTHAETLSLERALRTIRKRKRSRVTSMEHSDLMMDNQRQSITIDRRRI